MSLYWWKPLVCTRRTSTKGSQHGVDSFDTYCITFKAGAIDSFETCCFALSTLNKVCPQLGTDQRVADHFKARSGA